MVWLRRRTGVLVMLANRLIGLARGSGGNDPYWDNVVSLLHFDGTDGSTLFTDEKGLTWTATGTAALSTTEKKFGTASLRAGTGNAVNTSGNSGFNFYGTESTLELFLKLDSASSTGNLISEWNSNLRFNFYISASNTARFMFYEAPAALRQFTFPISYTGAFVHLALCRTSAGLFRAFVDGAEATVSAPGPYSGGVYAPTTEGVRIGSAACYVDELRITKGVARYTADFTPPSAPFQND